MCSRTRRLALFVGLALCGTHPLIAQRSTSVEIRAQERIVDSLVANWRRATAALRAFDDSASRSRAVTDTLRVGSLRVLVEPALRARVEIAARRAWTKVDSIAGAGGRRLEDRWLVVHAASDSSGDTLVVAVRGRDGSEYLQIWGSVSDSTLVAWLFRNAVQLLAMGIEVQMRNWLGASLAPDTLRTAQWLEVRLAIVSSPMNVARQCYDGDLSACKIALRLVDVDDPVMQWFDAAGRRRFVAQHVASYQSRRSVAEGCLSGNDAACVAFMRQIENIGDPIPPHRRMSVASIAVQMGGRAGFERMLTASGTPTERLVVTAGAPVDSVLRVWLGRAREARRPSQDMSPGIAVSSLGWVLVCGLLALRSTRWR